MTASPVQTPAARKAASTRATLDALAAALSAALGQPLAEMAARMSATLAEVDAPGLESREVYRRVKSARLLKDNGYAFVHLAEAAIEGAVRGELAGLAPGAARRQPAAALSLVPLADIDERLAFTALARPFDIQHADSLATLSVRLGLLLERGLLRADTNPFRPAVFLKALDDAWRAFEPDPEAHGLMASLLRPGIVFDLGPLFEQLIDALRRKDGQPGSVDALRIQKTDDAAAAKAARATAHASLAQQLRALFGDDGGDDGVPLIPELPAMPAGSGGWRPSAAAGFQAAAAGAPTSAGPAAAGQTTGQPSIQPTMQPSVQPGGRPAHAAVHAVPAGFAAAHGGLPPSAQGAAWVPVGAGSAVHAAQGFVASSVEQGGASAHWAGIPVQGLVAAASGGAPLAMPAGLAASAPLLDLLARIEPVLAGAAAGEATAARTAAQAGAAGAAAAGAAPHNVFYLPRLQQSLPRGSLSRADEHTLDLLARVFETVLLDDSIPPAARELLQALQLPVLKAALLDKRFFFEEAHPARRMVDLLSRMGWEQHKDGDDPVFQAMRRSVAQVADSDAGAGAGFEQAVAGLEASLAQEEDMQREALVAPVASALKQEKLSVAGRAARDAVALRIAAGLAEEGEDEHVHERAGDIAEVLSGFLEQRWTTVLTFAYSIEDDKPGAVGNATRAMDELIWSVKPKATQEQRKTLIARLPRLLATLNKWLDAIRWQDAERLRFFARLAEYHASIVRAPIELTPERQLELAVEAAQRDALRRVELENAAAEQEAARRQAFSPVDGLERGMWCEFRSEEGAPQVVRKLRLAWVSPLRTLFIFSAGGRREGFSMSAEKLAAALHAGAARVLALDGVVGQVLLAAMAGEAGGDTGLQASAAR
jgi:hypothetical protein